MKINFDDTSKMSAALSLANRGRYTEALPLFAQVNTYESALNQMACLCCMQEEGYACDLYLKTKQKYGFTHSLYADALTFGDLLSTVLDFCEHDRSYALAFDGETRADPALIAQYCYSNDSDYYDDDPPDSFFSTPPIAVPQGFYDVSGPMYIAGLRSKFENAMMNEDEKTVKELAKTILALSRTDLETLELQLAVITVRQNYKSKTALSVAERFADCNGGSVSAAGAALEAVLQNSPHKRLDTLGKLVRKLLADVQKIGAGELAELIFLSTDVLNDPDTAYKFAQTLYSQKENMVLDDYKVCATAFFNHGDRELSKEAMLTLAKYVPFDVYAAFWLEFVERAPRKNLLQIGEKTVRHFFVPYAVTSYVNAQMGQKLMGESLVLDLEDLNRFSVIFMYIKSLLIVGENNKYQETSAYVRAVLHTVPFRDKQEFFDFAVGNLLTMVNDHLLNQTLVARLAELGFDKKVFVGMTESYQAVDFAQIPKDDNLLFAPLGIALSVSRADVKALVSAYGKLKPLIEDEKFSLSLVHNLAYAMLCITKRGFEKSEESEFFAESETELYARYLKSLK
ncbi:MAG: hypothetical protein NC132_04500 [Corallococcus sp.]|nr:hypothetical protein [Corallococcus sp.]MCM1359646.1 hypothetical protein [Corallococcus sp.]MCM1395355.1 hypothetical protein [Corallococcus sp.]